MINIVTKKHKEDIGTVYGHLKYIQFPWTLFDMVSAQLYKLGEAEEVEKVITEIEGCEVVNSELFKSKFNGVPIKLSLLSTGSRTVLVVYYLAKYGQGHKNIIDITDCGSNAIEYMLDNYNKYDLTLYLGHYELLRDKKYSFLVDGESASCIYDIQR